MSSIQNYVGRELVRTVKFEDDQIILVTPPTPVNGKVQIVELIWQTDTNRLVMRPECLLGEYAAFRSCQEARLSKVSAPGKKTFLATTILQDPYPTYARMHEEGPLH